MRWLPSAADKAAFASAPVLAVVPGLDVLAFEGADAVAFLQGQTTMDVAAIAADGWQIGGYCTPKGRLLAIFQAWRHGADVRMLLPADIAPSVQRRLSLFVLRAKVGIRNASRDWMVLGLLGAGSGAALSAAGIDAPQAPGSSRILDGDERIVRLPAGSGCPERLLLLIRAEREAHWRTLLGAIPRVGPELWWWSHIDAAIPAVLAGTQELFVPQALNLEVLGGVNFRKGCYPGQEIVARSQYLGKLRRRMFLAHAADLGAGSDVYQDGAAEPVGRIVLAAGAPAGGWDLLFEGPTDRVDKGGLHAGSADAPLLHLRALPYALFDPTA
jgi:folate-binding protein YgfZ